MTVKTPVEPAAEIAAGTPPRVSYAVLDQALWKQFAEAQTTEEFTRVWLALLCRNIDGAAAGLVQLGDPETGPFKPIAHWPDEEQADSRLAGIAEQAIAKRQPVLINQQNFRGVSLPLVIDGHLYGAATVSVEPGGLNPNDIIRHLRWGAGWIETMLRRGDSKAAERLQERTAVALDMLANVLEQKRFRAACTALVTELAMRLECDPVSVGFVRGRRARVVAVSHASGFGARMNLIRDISTAMDEAIDQEAVVLYPANPDWDYRVTLAHEELARAHKVSAALTVPIQHDGEIVGAITFERTGGAGFDEDTVELCDAIATIIGPVLEEKRRNDRTVVSKLFATIKNQLVRLLGPSHFGRKLATLIFLALVAFFATARTDFQIASPAVVEGTIQRTVVAPFNGYLASESVRAGAIAEEDDLLAKLDDQDLVLERLRLTTSRAQRETEFDRALANRERAEVAIIESQIDQADSQIALIDEQLARTRIVAPFDGIVVSGDLSQSVGTAVERGQELFQIAPLNAYRVILEVDEADIAEIEPGQTGLLRVVSLPDQPLAYTVERITPIAVQKEGRNFFRVEASLDEISDRLRPSMEGVARTEIDERLLIAAWMRPIISWLKLTVWRWTP